MKFKPGRLLMTRGVAEKMKGNDNFAKHVHYQFRDTLPGTGET